MAKKNTLLDLFPRQFKSLSTQKFSPILHYFVCHFRPLYCLCFGSRILPSSTVVTHPTITFLGFILLRLATSVYYCRVVQRLCILLEQNAQVQRIPMDVKKTKLCTPYYCRRPFKVSVTEACWCCFAHGFVCSLNGSSMSLAINGRYAGLYVYPNEDSE